MQKARVDESTDRGDGLGPCCLFEGALDQNGHGNVSLGGRTAGTDKAHRIAYREHHGPIPAGHVVRHKCDTRNCIAGLHLETGTQLENLRDMYSRGRDRWSRRREQDHTSIEDAMACCGPSML